MTPEERAAALEAAELELAKAKARLAAWKHPKMVKRSRFDVSEAIKAQQDVIRWQARITQLKA
jgi:hypothetical protein